MTGEWQWCGIVSAYNAGVQTCRDGWYDLSDLERSVGQKYRKTGEWHWWGYDADDLASDGFELFRERLSPVTDLVDVLVAGEPPHRAYIMGYLDAEAWGWTSVNLQRIPRRPIKARGSLTGATAKAYSPVRIKSGMPYPTQTDTPVHPGRVRSRVRVTNGRSGVL